MKCYYSVLADRFFAFDLSINTPNSDTLENATEINKKELTFGQKAVGASFNPSFMPEVDKVKNLFAETIDTLEANHKKNCEVLGPTWERKVFRTEAYNAVVRASSAVVKYLTWKD